MNGYQISKGKIGTVYIIHENKSNNIEYHYVAVVHRFLINLVYHKYLP